MIVQIWIQVAYMAQLIVACGLFIMPVSKRRSFPMRAALCSIGLLAFTVAFALAVPIPSDLLSTVLYWPIFAVVCVPAIAVCINGIIYHISDALCCFYIMWTQRSNHDKASLQRELDGVRYTLLQQQKQYAINQETVDIINRKCHDLKHQIHMLQTMQESPERDAYFAEAEQAIMIYDTRIKTGNKALDTVLMEKGLYCQSHNIQLTCMPSGDSLDFMQVADIYALFGNALDNAINAEMEIDDPSKRVINVRFSSQGALMLIQIQNYHQRKLRFSNGLPVTTHRDRTRHGFGMKSMLHTVQQYGGTMQASDADNVFTLQILLPKDQSR